MAGRGLAGPRGRPASRRAVDRPWRGRRWSTARGRPYEGVVYDEVGARITATVPVAPESAQDSARRRVVDHRSSDHTPAPRPVCKRTGARDSASSGVGPPGDRRCAGAAAVETSHVAHAESLPHQRQPLRARLRPLVRSNDPTRDGDQCAGRSRGERGPEIVDTARPGRQPRAAGRSCSASTSGAPPAGRERSPRRQPRCRRAHSRPIPAAPIPADERGDRVADRASAGELTFLKSAAPRD